MRPYNEQASLPIQYQFLPCVVPLTSTRAHKHTHTAVHSENLIPQICNTHPLIRAGEAELAELALPTRRQEPYRYTDLESLYRTDFLPAPTATETAAAAVKPYLLEASKGHQMVFVNGVFSEELSDVSALGGVEGLVAGHVGAMEGAPLDQVGGFVCWLLVLVVVHSLFCDWRLVSWCTCFFA